MKDTKFLATASASMQSFVSFVVLYLELQTMQPVAYRELTAFNSWKACCRRATMLTWAARIQTRGS